MQECKKNIEIQALITIDLLNDSKKKITSCKTILMIFNWKNSERGFTSVTLLGIIIRKHSGWIKINWKFI